MTDSPRDSRAPADYWDRQVPSTQQFRDVIAEQLDRPLDQWRKAEMFGLTALSLVEQTWFWFSSRYSAGASVGALREDFETVLRLWETAAPIAAAHVPADVQAKRDAGPPGTTMYAYRLWLVSLGLAFEVDDETFARVVELARPGFGDRVLDRMIAARVPEHRIGDELTRPKAVANLDAVWDAPNRSAAMKKYLNGWYKGWKGLAGWGRLPFAEQGHYFGYWAFETVGVVKALGIDDSSFRDQEYYPGDLLH